MAAKTWTENINNILQRYQGNIVQQIKIKLFLGNTALLQTESNITRRKLIHEQLSLIINDTFVFGSPVSLGRCLSAPRFLFRHRLSVSFFRSNNVFWYGILAKARHATPVMASRLSWQNPNWKLFQSVWIFPSLPRGTRHPGIRVRSWKMPQIHLIPEIGMTECVVVARVRALFSSEFRTCVMFELAPLNVHESS
jgi:hypothetical protein